ncbi:MAG: formylglycine-generating enzyme family protein [Planctomycetes bacterium]|nr:formylglycine-generating enzyme family protein [Planctomycetota bacterium]
MFRTSIVVVFWLSWLTGAAGQDQATSQPNPSFAVLARAKDEYMALLTEARKRVLTAFDTEAARVTKSPALKAEDRIRRLEQLAEERKAFESQGILPTSAAFKTAISEYRTRLNEARAKCEQALDAAADALAKTGDLTRAKEILASKRQLLASVVPTPVELLQLPSGKTTQVVTNSLGMRLVLIPPGEFNMGDDPVHLQQPFKKSLDSNAFADEQPRHPVRITRGFYLGMHEVTLGQFRQFADQAMYRTEAEDDGKGGGWDQSSRKFVDADPKYNWRDPGFPQADDHPVVDASWNDAIAFCKWLGANEGKHYRLPTEAEWEYAGRAGTATHYSNGDEIADLADVANSVKGTRIRGNDGYEFTAPAGSFRMNAFGTFDQHGNVLEWCDDWYASDSYQTSAASDPKGPANGTTRVARGGGFRSTATELRSADRSGFEPPARACDLGFRVV